MKKIMEEMWKEVCRRCFITWKIENMKLPDAKPWKLKTKKEIAEDLEHLEAKIDELTEKINGTRK